MLIEEYLASGVELRTIEPGIVSVLPPQEEAHHYDAIARLYDLVIGNGLYNRLLWGNGPADYSAFCQAALDSADGPYLDTGCGTLVFTARAYGRSERPLVLLDRSLGMLQKARQRLEREYGGMPGHVMLVQGDIFRLPFRDGVFGTVASYGLLHLFADLAPLVGELRRVADTGASVWLSSLVREQGLGRYYYDLLQRSGEIACRRKAEDISALLRGLGEEVEGQLKGNMLNLVLRGK